MKKYRLNVAFGEYKVGHVFETDQDGCVHMIKGEKDFYSLPIEIAHMLHTGFLSEVEEVEEEKEKEWPQKGDECYSVHGDGFIQVYQWSDSIKYKEMGNVFRTREEAEAALERVKLALKQ